MENSLFENISELGKLRSTSLALQRGEYSTRLAMANLLVYNMTHDDQVMSIVLNRGAPTSVNGFEGNDVVRFGSTFIQNGILNAPAHSVTVIELNVENEPLPVYGCTDPTATNFDSSATYDDGSCDYPVVPVLGCTDSTATNYDSEATEDDGTCNYSVEDVVGCMDSDALNFNPNATIDEGCEYVTDGGGLNETNQSQGQNNTDNQTDPTNGTIDNQSTQQEMKTCDLCCGNTYEVPADEVCPIAACEPCEQTEGADSKSSSIMLARSVLIGAIVIVALVLILSGRKGGGIEGDSIEDEWTPHEN